MEEKTPANFWVIDTVCGLQEKVLINRNGQIQVFDQRGKFVFKLDNYNRDVDKTMVPDGVCVCKDRIFICDAKNYKIQVFTLEGKYIYSIPVPGCPERICTSPRGNVIILTARHEIINLDGDMVKTLFICDRHLFWLSGICCNKRGEIIIVNQSNDQLMFVDGNGRVLHRFGSRGTGPNQFWNPYGICLDKEDNIYVADYGNDRISIFDANLIYIRQVAVRMPLQICLMEKRMIVVTEKTVYIFSN